jgi:hypothetical protein
MLFSAMLMVIMADEQPKIWLRTNPTPTTVAKGVPPMIRKQSTQLSTPGYLRKNCSKMYAVYVTVRPRCRRVSDVVGVDYALAYPIR